MKTTLKWIAGVIFIIAGLGTLITGGLGILGGLLLILAGLICLPPTLVLIETKLNTTLATPLKYILVIGLWIAGAALIPKTSLTNKKEKLGSSSKDSQTEKGEVVKSNDTKATAITDTASKIDKTNEQLKRELKSFETPFSSSTYKGSVTSIQMELVLFSAYTSIIKEGKESNKPENIKLSEQLEKKVTARQIAEFPKMRKNYAEAAAEKLWESNIYVTVGGSNNSTINLSGGLFASNKNIAETQKTLQEVLAQFRFKEIRFRWYKGADEFTYYKLDTPKDSEPVNFGQ